MTHRRVRARKSRSSDSSLSGVLPFAPGAAAAAPGPRTESLCVSAVRRRSLAHRKGAELLAGGTRKRGSPAAIAITAPFPGAAIEPVSSLHSDPRAPSGRYAHALRVPFSLEAMRPWRTPGRAGGPGVAHRNSHEHDGRRTASQIRILSGRGESQSVGAVLL